MKKEHDESEKKEMVEFSEGEIDEELKKDLDYIEQAKYAALGIKKEKDISEEVCGICGQVKDEGRWCRCNDWVWAEQICRICGKKREEGCGHLQPGPTGSKKAELKKRTLEEVVEYYSIKHAEWLALKADMLKALEAAERNPGGNSEYCPVCGKNQALLMGGWEDHASDCILVSALKKARGEQ